MHKDSFRYGIRAERAGGLESGQPLALTTPLARLMGFMEGRLQSDYRKVESPPASADATAFRARARPQPSALPHVRPQVKFTHARCATTNAEGRTCGAVLDGWGGARAPKSFAIGRRRRRFKFRPTADGRHEIPSGKPAAPAAPIGVRIRAESFLSSRKPQPIEIFPGFEIRNDAARLSSGIRIRP